MDKFKEAYKILDELTPLNIDCGTLCDKVCCNGDDDTGMLLYPGEELLYEDYNEDWCLIQESNIALSNDSKIHLLTCNSKCDPTHDGSFPTTQRSESQTSGNGHHRRGLDATLRHDYFSCSQHLEPPDTARRARSNCPAGLGIRG